MKVSIRHLGPSMIQQMQHPCNECKGTGETINDKDRCSQCKGEKVVQEKKVLEVIVEKGMQNGQKITFPGEADEAPDTVTGDIVFVLQQKEHPKFKRKGDDLFVEHTLSLVESLCGFQFILTHLDGRQLLIKTLPGVVVKPDQFKAINDEGMPMYQRPFMKGKLYIHFSVEFPDSLNPEQCKALEGVLDAAALPLEQGGRQVLGVALVLSQQGMQSFTRLGHSAFLQQLRRQLRPWLEPVALPRSIRLFPALPLTGAGKRDGVVLRQAFDQTPLQQPGVPT